MSTQKTAYLRVLNGPIRGGVFVLANLSLYELGRGEGCHVKLPDNRCSLSHARIGITQGSWTFYNLSESGSAINDIRVDQRHLEGGEILRIGETELHFSFDPPAKNADSGIVQASLDSPREMSSAPAESAPSDFEVPSMPAAAHSQPLTNTPMPTTPAAGLDQPLAPPSSEPALAALDQPLAAGPLFTLRVIEGSDADIGREYQVYEGRACVIGRSLSANFVLMDAKISRHHCELKIERGAIVVTDLNSANGTVVNGERIGRGVMNPGDYLRLGFTVIGCEPVSQPTFESPV